MPIDFRSDTWRQVAADQRARLKKAVQTVLKASTPWEGVLVARQQYRDALEFLSQDPDFKKPDWSSNDD